MKNISLFLLALNLAYFLWEITIGDPGAQGQSGVMDLSNNRNRIVLIDEALTANAKRLEPVREIGRPTSGSKKTVTKVFIADPPDFNGAAMSTSVEDALLANAKDELSRKNEAMLAKQSPDILNTGVSQLDISKALDKPKSLNAKGPICYRVGPWLSKTALNKVSSGLFRKGYESNRGSKLVEVKTGYMVYFPAASSYEESRANLKMLKSKGLNDVWMFRKGNKKGTISLGRFKERERALAMKENLLERNINARIKALYTKKNGYFLTFRWQGSTQEFKTLIQYAGATLDGLERLPLRACS